MFEIILQGEKVLTIHDAPIEDDAFEFAYDDLFDGFPLEDRLIRFEEADDV